MSKCKWILTIALIIVLGTALLEYLDHRSDYNRIVSEFVTYMGVKIERMNGIPHPDEETVKQSRITSDCSSGYSGLVTSGSYKIKIYGVGKAEYEGRGYFAKPSAAHTTQIDPKDYKALLLEAYDENLFALSKIQKSPIADAGGCTVSFYIGNETKKVSTGQLGQSPSAKEVYAYARKISNLASQE